MAKKPIHSPDELRQLLRCNPETGKLWWKAREAHWFEDGVFPAAVKARAWNKRFAGREGFVGDNGKGYRFSNICGQKYYAHRVIWALVFGPWPLHEIDHINGVRDDNRIENLREATTAENGRNKGISRMNSSGFKGVSLFKATGRWEAYISPGGSKKKHLGFFATRDEAAAAYAAAAAEYHGQFARLV